jgi:hypothetical protein
MLYLAKKSVHMDREKFFENFSKKLSENQKNVVLYSEGANCS